MSKPDAPAAPDYAAAAEKTAAGNRVNQYTPYGSLTYSPPTSGNKDDPWSQHVNLSPVGQQLLDYDNATKLGLGKLQTGGLDYVQNAMQHLPSEADLPARQLNPGQTAQDAIMARLQPTWNAKQASLENQLSNQGIARGSEAYTNAMRDFNSGRNDAEMQAALQGINVGQQARQQGMQEQNFYASEPINILNAVRTGAQVQNPTFGSTPTGPNYLGAAQAQNASDLGVYNSKVGSYNSMMGGLMKLGGTLML